MHADVSDDGTEDPNVDANVHSAVSVKGHSLRF